MALRHSIVFQSAGNSIGRAAAVLQGAGRVIMVRRNFGPAAVHLRHGFTGE